MQHKQILFILDVSLTMNAGMFSCHVSSVHLSQVTHSLLERIQRLWLLLDHQLIPEDTLALQVIYVRIFCCIDNSVVFGWMCLYVYHLRFLLSNIWHCTSTRQCIEIYVVFFSLVYSGACT